MDDEINFEDIVDLMDEPEQPAAPAKEQENAAPAEDNPKKARATAKRTKTSAEQGGDVPTATEPVKRSKPRAKAEEASATRSAPMQDVPDEDVDAAPKAPAASKVAPPAQEVEAPVEKEEAKHVRTKHLDDVDDEEKAASDTDKREASSQVADTPSETVKAEKKEEVKQPAPSAAAKHVGTHESNSLFARFMRNNTVRNVISTFLVLVATAGFYLALYFAKTNSVENLLHIALSSDINDSTHVIALILFVMLEVYTALAIALVVAQFKKPTSAALIPAIQMPILIISFIMMAAVSTYKKTASLFFGMSIGFTVLVLVTGIMYHLFDEKKMDIKREGRRRSLLLMGLAILFEATVFFMPIVYFSKADGGTQYEVLYNVFSRSNYTLLSSVLFLVYFILFVASLVYAINHFKYLYQNNDRFNGKLSNLVYLSSGMTFTFFLVGTLITFYYKSKGIHTDAVTLSYVPFLLSSGLLLADAVYNGRFKEIKEESTHKGLSMRTLMLFYVVVFSALTILSLLSNLIIATFENPTYEVLRINGFDVLAHYKDYGESYQTIAFFLMAIILISVLFLIFSVISFFKNSKVYKNLFIFTIVVDFLSIAALAAFGKYYEIVQKANIERLSTLFAYYGFSVDAKCEVTSDVLYYFLAAVGLLISLFMLKPYTKFVIEENAKDVVSIADGSVIGLENKSAEPAAPAAPVAPVASEAVAEPVKDESKQEEPKKEEAPKEEPKQEESKKEEEPRKVEIPEEDDIFAEGYSIPVNRPSEPLEVTLTPQSKAASVLIDQCPPFTFIDQQEPLYRAQLARRVRTKFENVTLKSLVNFVVDYAKNSRLHLSYTTRDIATFIAGLGISRLSILQGMSGTGKTSLPKIFSEALFGNCEIVEVESSWKDKNELLGYYNEFSKIYTPKKFTQDLYKAKHNPHVITFIVLDEMNLSRIEYYFSDFLSLMENEENKREIKLVNIRIANYESGERVSYKYLTDDMVLKIPKNVWFIGTANRDESTFEISDKVYDRASTMNFNKRAKKITEFDAPMTPRFLDTNTFRQLLNEATEKMTFNLSDMKQIAQAEELLAPYNLSFGNRIERQIENFVKIYSACFEGEDVVHEAVEMIFLSKVVAKLEFKTVENKEELAEKFGEIGFAKCAEFVRKLNEDI